MQQATVFPYLLCLAIMVAAAVVAAVAALARQRLAADLASARESTVRLEGQLAVEQVRASRVADLEQAIAEHARLADALRTAAANADRECATARGELSRVAAALQDVRARLGEAEGALAAARTEREGFRTELATLHAGLAEQLAVLLLRHPLAALLDDRTHTSVPSCWEGRAGAPTRRRARAGRRPGAHSTGADRQLRCRISR